MKSFTAAVLLISLSMLSFPLGAQGAEEKKPALRDEGNQSMDELAKDFRAWLGRWWEYFGGTTSPEQQPVISLMLRNREKLGLTAEQVKTLEELRDEFEKESIRNGADIRVAEIDLTNLLQASSADLPKIEAKVREIERLRGDLRIARIRAIAKGKALLTAEQRNKLNQLILDKPFSRFQSWSGR